MSPVATLLRPEVKGIAVGDLWQPYVTDTKVSGEEFVENCMLERLG